MEQLPGVVFSVPGLEAWDRSPSIHPSPSATLPSAQCSRSQASSQDAHGTCPPLSRQPPLLLSPDQENRPFASEGSEDRASQRSWHCTAPVPVPSSSVSERPKGQDLHGREAKLVRNPDLSGSTSPFWVLRAESSVQGHRRGWGLLVLPVGTRATSQSEQAWLYLGLGTWARCLPSKTRQPVGLLISCV